MNKNLSPLRPAMTAIAAVIALSSTSAFAQTTAGAADQAAPVIVAPPAPTEAAPPAVAQTAAPEVSAPVAAEPAPAMKTVGTPVVHEAETSATSSTVAAAPTRSAPVKRISTAPSARASVPAATAAVTPAKVDTAPAPLPAAVAKAVPTAAETAAATPPAPTPVAAASQTQTTQHATSLDDDALPIAGGVGLAVIALGGAAAYGISRRRRERQEELVLERAPVETAAIPVAEPVVVAKTAPAPKTRGRMPKALPNGFDISRFGRHTQAAYLGPTEDNPSFSLKRRLKRASFFDQREREAAEAKVEKKAAVAEAPATQSAAAKSAAKDDGQITIRLAPQRKRGGGYVLQR